MDELSLDNFLEVGEDVDLFGEGPAEVKNEGEEVTPPSPSENNENNTNPTEVDTENLFDVPEKPESKSSEENTEGKEDTTSSKDDGTSPNNFYSSIAKALVEEGVYSSEDVDEIKTAEDFVAMAKKSAESQLTDIQKRVNDALNAGVEVSEIQKYERGISQLENISEDDLNAENENGQKLRNWVIYQDYISKGISEERAKKMLQASIKAGTDMEDAQDALASVIDHYKGEYGNLVKQKQEELKAQEENTKKETAALKKSILEDEKIFGDVEVDKATRQKAFEALSKPVYRDPNTGEMLSELQKYQTEHEQEYLQKVSIIYAMTNGFKDIDRLVKSKVNKEIKKGVRDLERTLNNTSRGFDGNIKFVSGVSDDPEAFIGKGMKLDL